MANLTDVKTGKLHAAYPQLYGNAYDEKEMDQRMIHLLLEHDRLFGEKNASLFSTAGRSELGGNHTDHNLGRVLAATINLDTIAAASRSDDGKVVLASEGFPVVKVDISDLSVHSDENNTTDSLVRGIAEAFQERGIAVGGWKANTTTKVLKGSGLSSSAAIEVLCATIFNHFYGNDALTPVDLAQMGQFAENSYFGKPSGLLDQIACAHGGIVGIDFKDKDNPVITPLDVNFQDYGYDLVVVDTKGDHANLTGEYAAVPAEMRSVAAFFGKKQLREVPYGEFLAHIAEIREKVGNDRAVLRAYHFFNDSQRVSGMLDALSRKDIAAYFRLVNDSGESSFCFLQNAYAISDYQHQGVPVALALSLSVLDGKGACRVHGGGFGGTIQAYVPHEIIADYTSKMEAVFGRGSVTILGIRSRSTCAVAN